MSQRSESRANLDLDKASWNQLSLAGLISSFPPLFIHSSHKCLPSAYCATGDTAVNKTGKNLCPLGADFYKKHNKCKGQITILSNANC